MHQHGVGVFVGRVLSRRTLARRFSPQTVGALTLIGVIGLLAPCAASASSGWSDPTNIEEGFDGASGANELKSVSCPSASFCAAVDEVGNAFTYDGSVWSSPSEIGGLWPIASVSCTSDSFCIAVDERENVFTYDGSTWSAPVSVASSGGFYSVSCSSASFCMATSNGAVATYDGSAWSWSGFIHTAPAGEHSFYAFKLWSVSCASSSFCATVDGWGKALTYDGTSWSTPIALEPHNSTDGSGVLTSVSCPSASFCVAVDNAGNAIHYTGGGSWSTPTNIDGTDVRGVSYLAAVSCPSASFCVAVDWGGRALTYDGSSWSAPSTIDPGHALSSVSCPSDLFCVAVGYSGNVLTFRGESPPPSSTGLSPLSLEATSRSRETLGTVHVGRVRVRGLTARVPLRCTGSGDSGCEIALSMRAPTTLKRGKLASRRHGRRSNAKTFRRTVIVGKKSVRLNAKRQRLVRIKLNTRGRHLLKTRRRLPARLRIAQTTHSGIASIANRRVTFRVQKHRKGENG